MNSYRRKAVRQRLACALRERDKKRRQKFQKLIKPGLPQDGFSELVAVDV